MRKGLVLTALVISSLLFQITGCKTNETSMDSKKNAEDNMVIPRIADAAPSRLSESYSYSGSSNYYSNKSDNDPNLESIVISSPVSFLDENKPNSNTTPNDWLAIQSSVEANSPSKASHDDLQSTVRANDSLREALRDRVEAVNQLFPDTDRNRLESVKDANSPVVTFRCSVLRGGKFKSGDRITLRVLEEVNQNGFSVKKHDLIEGYCSIENRVHIAVHRVRGQPITLYGYDLDGMEGLWFTGRDEESTGSSISDELITEGTSLLSSRVGRIARGITSVGAESIKRKGRSTCVDIPSGHEFLLGLIIQ